VSGIPGDDVKDFVSINFWAKNIGKIERMIV
jgi:hypothetical protein